MMQVFLISLQMIIFIFLRLSLIICYIRTGIFKFYLTEDTTIFSLISLEIYQLYVVYVMTAYPTLRRVFSSCASAVEYVLIWFKGDTISSLQPAKRLLYVN